MRPTARLLYKSYMTYFHSFLPVYFYGMPNGKIYCLYAQLAPQNGTDNMMDFTFMEHEDFSYDHKSDTIQICGDLKISHDYFKDMVDRPDQRLKALGISGKFESYSAAQKFLDTVIIERFASMEFERA